MATQWTGGKIANCLAKAVVLLVHIANLSGVQMVPEYAIMRLLPLAIGSADMVYNTCIVKVHKIHHADYSRCKVRSKLNSGKPQLNLVIFSVSAGPSSWFKHSKLIVVFHSRLQDFCNMLHKHKNFSLCTEHKIFKCNWKFTVCRPHTCGSQLLAIYS